MCDIDRVSSNVRGSFRVTGYFFDRCSHRYDRLGCSIDLTALNIRGSCHVTGRAFGLLGRRIDHDRGFIDRCYQLAELFDSVINGVGNRPRNIFRYCCFNSQVSVSQTPEFIEQAKNRLLVAVILLSLHLGRALEYRRL